EKLGQVREGSLSSTSSRAVRLSEAEANSYFQYHMAYLFPAGLSNVRVKFEPNRPQGWAEVDFDRLKETLRRPPNPFVDYLLQGVHTLGVQGTFDSSNGMGEFRWETVTMDGVVLPRAMVDFLIESYLKARYPQAAIDQPFRLPYSLEKVVVEAGSCLMISKPASL
ncbi:MAG: hypothetical protein HY647_08990, partial [Acidobacteria bacterium]|nr:hypothetical protein [Acidobacteriota bacterium]